MTAPKQNIGAYLKQEGASNAHLGNVPFAADTVRTSAAIDRLGFDSCNLYCLVGAATGTPATQSAIAKITHCATEGGSYVDLTGATTVALTTDSKIDVVAVNLRGANRYIKVVETVALTGGSTPKLPCASGVVLGGAETLPAA